MSFLDQLTIGNLAGNFLFSGIGFVAFTYGKRNNEFRKMLLGGALMGFPYFVSDTLTLYVVGAALTATLFL